MQARVAIVAGLLLAGCVAAGDGDGEISLPPVSYWVVTQTFPGEATPGGVPRCAPGVVTRPAELRFAYPATVTLATLEHGFFLNDGATTPTGTLLRDGRLTLFGHEVEYTGRFQDADHFTLEKRVFRSTAQTDTCAVHVAAYRYEGPRVCEVTTEDEEAALRAAVRDAVDASNLGAFRAFFERYWRLPFPERIFPVTATAPGMYALAATGWVTTATTTAYRFTYADGFVFDRDAAWTHFSLTAPEGATLTGEQGADTLRLVVDGVWAMDFGPDTFIIMSAPAQAQAMAGELIEPIIPSYYVTGYQTPLGEFVSRKGTQSARLSAAGLNVAVTAASDAVTLANGNASKTVAAADQAQFCPAPGEALFEAFPNLLQEIGFCTTTPLRRGEVTCELIGP